jgi:patatin-like phospholipase/acyl hydrolase
MTTLFDMIAGSSTGSVVAAALVCPSVENKTKNAYFADTVINFYKEKGPELY